MFIAQRHGILLAQRMQLHLCPMERDLLFHQCQTGFDLGDLLLDVRMDMADGRVLPGLPFMQGPPDTDLCGKVHLMRRVALKAIAQRCDV